MLMYIPIVMHGLLLFYKNYRIIHLLLSFEMSVSITLPSFIALHLILSEIVKCIA